MKMTKVEYKILSYVVYPFDVMVSFRDNFEDVRKDLKKMVSNDVWYEIGGVDMNTIGRTFMFSSGQTIIWLKSVDHGNIAHEVFHAVTFLMDRIGVVYDMRVSDEAYAYLIGYLTKEIYKLIKD